MLTIERFLYGIIILLTYSAIRYFWRFRFNVEYDNFYITNYFRHLDQRRKIAKRTSVFPLSYTERAMYVDVFNLYDNISFKKKNKYSGLLLMILSLEIIPAFLFTVLSCMFSSLLCAINSCSLVTYNQEGEHEVRFRVSILQFYQNIIFIVNMNFSVLDQWHRLDGSTTSHHNEEFQYTRTCLHVSHQCGVSTCGSYIAT